MCEYYGIPLQPQVNSGPVWNLVTEQWETRLVPLPVTPQGRLVLVPKVIVRHRLSYDAHEYYRHYLLPELQQEHLSTNTALVQTLKDGRKRVTKKSLIKKYGTDKLATTDLTIARPFVFERYRKTKGRKAPAPLTHDQLAEIERTEIPDWPKLLSNLRAIPSGNEASAKYEDIIERILSALFYPALCSPVKQHEIHQGRKRIDITYVNTARRGFFAWAAQHYPAAHVFVECKNYGKEVGNPEIDQLSGRFSPTRGKIGLLACRSISDKNSLLTRCRDTALDDRGFILPLDDSDLDALVQEKAAFPSLDEFSLLRRLFNHLMM